MQIQPSDERRLICGVIATSGEYLSGKRSNCLPWKQDMMKSLTATV